MEKQELLSVLHSGILLYSRGVIEPWRKKTSFYPDEITQKMVAEFLPGISVGIQEQRDLVRSQDWIRLYSNFLDIGRRLFLTLLGLNRTWVYTDHPDLKGMNAVAGELELQPEDFVHRLGQLLQGNADAAISGFAVLCEEVMDLVETHLPSVDLASDRARLRLA